MNRFESHFARLYGLASENASSLLSAETPPSTRLLIIEAQGPEAWSALSTLWQGVQDDWQWPAPAIVVSGTHGFQLWISLATPQPADLVRAVGLQCVSRYLPNMPASRVAVYPRVTPPTDATHSWQHVPHRPMDSPVAGQWAACVARDLAPVFADTPWLDIPPNPEGQADLLAGLRSVSASQWDAQQPSTLTTPAPDLPSPQEREPASNAPPATPNESPRDFLTRVMNDPTVDIRWRIEAAKALLNGR